MKAAVRDVQCPNCGVVHATARRWQFRCPECNHTWIDRSSRTVLDEIRDAMPSLLGTLFLGACVAFAAYVVLAIVAATVGRFGVGRSLPVGLFIFACAAAIVALGLLRNRIPIQKPQRRSSWRPESGFEIPLASNLRPFGPGVVVGNTPREPEAEEALPEGDNGVSNG